MGHTSADDSTSQSRHEPNGRLWIVTGATGFLGNTVVRRLLARGERVRAVVSPNSASDSRRLESLRNLDCERRVADVRSVDDLERAFERDGAHETFVVHCAGVISLGMKLSHTLKTVNVVGTENVVTACRRTRVNRLLYVSTVHALEEPSQGVVIYERDDPQSYLPERIVGGYAQSKTLATRLVLEATDLWRVVVLPSGMAGPGCDNGRNQLNRLVRDASRGRPLFAVEGGYNIVDVRDVASGIVSALEHGNSGQTFILSGSYVSIPDLLASARTAAPHPPTKDADKPQQVRVIPLWLASVFAPLAEFFASITRTSPRFTRYSLYTVRSSANFSQNRAREVLGFQPRPLAETVRHVIVDTTHTDSV